MKITLITILFLIFLVVPSFSTDIPSNLPEMPFDTYVFSQSPGNLKHLRGLVVNEEEKRIDDIMPALSEKGVVVFILPKEDLYKALDTSAADGIVSTDKEFILKVKEKYPEGFLINLHPKPKILELKKE
jgi:hypothetical protein